MKNLCRKIGLPEEVIREILRLHQDPGFQPDSSGLRRAGCWDEALAGLKEALGEDPSGYRQLCCMLRCALEARRDYEALGLPETVYYDTFACFTRFVQEYRESYGSYGFDRGFWTVRQVSCRLFRIGELEYELTELEGEKAISLHIPSDARLDRFLSSWEAALELLYRCFPEYEAAPVFCRSWLLAPELNQLLGEGSRILAFQRAFRIRPLGVSAWGFRQWVFKDPRLAPEEYPEDTSLQRSLKAWVLNGGTLTDGLGILIR